METRPEAPSRSAGANKSARARTIALVSLILAAAPSSALLFDSPIGLPYVPVFLVSSAIAVAGTIAALFGTRGASTTLRVGLVLTAVASFGVALWDLGLAWLIVMFPKC